MESLVGNPKMREVLFTHLHTFEELEKDIQAYIHFYNYERLQAKLNGKVIKDDEGIALSSF
ncbi:IS3 family transposase [Paenibacillus sp. MER TA 81-3]|uniref:IS3 family transposase n=1 Tax=Paenibacillus sp. MER TA 81-3 TaxID=2939573 RepID=UPI00204140E6|nr:IS3 family transposase [Paenibacillus sp. MER TA 81-3]